MRCNACVRLQETVKENIYNRMTKKKVFLIHAILVQYVAIDDVMATGVWAGERGLMGGRAGGREVSFDPVRVAPIFPSREPRR